MYYKDLTKLDGFHTVGYLDSHHEYTRGVVPRKFLRLLRERVKYPDCSYRGFHVCEFCTGETCSSDIIVKWDNTLVFQAPSMILHYIEQHEYYPPELFIEAIMEESRCMFDYG
jgi:hypothetical protein